MEKICKKHGASEFKKRTDGSHRCNKCNVEAVTKRRKKIKLLGVEFLGGRCNRCGYKKSVHALLFHHINPEEKSFTVSSKGIIRSWEKTKKELLKCELLCWNCHIEEHFGNGDVAE